MLDYKSPQLASCPIFGHMVDSLHFSYFPLAGGNGRFSALSPGVASPRLPRTWTACIFTSGCLYSAPV